MKLGAHRYGKSRVRLLKVLRGGPTHSVKELTAQVLLEGDFERSFTGADNANVVATDTMKNTVNVLAHEHLGLDNEPFARRVAEHFLSWYPFVARVTIELDERVWTRAQVDGTGHPHTFIQGEAARPFTRVVGGREGLTHESGLRELTLLKSTGSGFAGFHRDDLTTLPETDDRVLATSLRVSWIWRSEPASYRTTARTVVSAMLAPFATRYSPSAQSTLFAMATAALEACPEIDHVTLTMPNLHCLPIDLTPFGRTNRQELFVPTDEPHGHIEATVSR
jgi:urate oxidase